MPWGAIIPAAIQGVSALIGGRSAKKAAKQISAAATKQAGETRATGEKVTGRMGEMYEKGVGQLDPYAQAGKEGLASLSDFLGGAGGQMFKFDPSKAAVDPSMDFRIREGQKAIERSAAAKGNLFSGGMLKELTQYGQDVASQEYQNMFNRALAEYNTGNQVYNRLMGLTGLGYGAASDIAGLGTNFANAAGGIDMATQQAINDLLLQGAGAQASGTMGAGNAWQQALGAAGNAVSSQVAFNRMRDLLGMQGGGAASPGYTPSAAGMPAGQMGPATPWWLQTGAGENA